MFEFLAGIFFNSIWLLGSAACYFLLGFLFSFIALPGWLEKVVIVALSFWGGLTGMFVFIELVVNKGSRAEFIDKLKAMSAIGLAILAACLFAVLFHLILSPYQIEEETEKWLVGLSSCALWFLWMSVLIKRLERQSEAERHEHSQKYDVN